MTYQREVSGTVVLGGEGGGGAWDDEGIAWLVEVAGQLGIALQQVAAHAHLRILSSTDALTGLLNRRAFDEALAGRVAAASATGTLVYVDLDNFKKVNDGRGHQVGDRALIPVDDILKQTGRASGRERGG